MEDYILKIAKRSKDAAGKMASLETSKKNRALNAMAKALIGNKAFIMEENKKDILNGKNSGLSGAMIDRLMLTESRIENMAESLQEIARFEDPIGEVTKGWQHENGMNITQVRVPIGVIGMIYESRPNVTVDAAGLCLKSGNTIILRGGSEAIHSNKALAKIIGVAAEKEGIPKGAIQLIEETDRALVTELIRMNDYVDVVIPRGGKGLKRAILANATVPVIETGAGLCHVYVDADADIEMAEAIIVNSKTQRTGVCNATETLLVHRDIAGAFLPRLSETLGELDVELRCCEEALKLVGKGVPATEEDWATEYLDLILSIKVVASIEAAITHINEYGTKHSEAIVTADYGHSEMFLNQVDAAAVYVNASTRFTDGGVFGFGGEIGISTQKLHARGPMGIRELTSLKYAIRGNGQTR